MNRWILLPPVFLIACGGASTPGDDDTTDVPDSCPSLYAQDVMPEFHVVMTDTDWAAMTDEFLHVEERTAAGMDPTPYHPIDLHVVTGDTDSGQIANAMIRLKGASSWLQTIQLDQNPKMQFVISFNELDHAARFDGVRKVDLDMPRGDQTFLQQRVSLAYLRVADTMAPCANSARVYINGTYYGLYTNLEHQDKEYVQRIFPDADDGDLWKNGRTIKTNEDTFSWDHLDAFWSVSDLDRLRTLSDLDTSIHEWAAEEMIGDADGYANGRANFYLYDHPTRGFIWLPNDLDTALNYDYLPADSSPVMPPAMGRWEPDWEHFMMVMSDPAGIEQFVDALHGVRASYDVATVQRHIDEWDQQIVTAATEDPHRPFTMTDHALAVMRMMSYAGDRAEQIDTWLACRDGAGGDDADNDGSDMCHDCDDSNGAVHPGAPETCNMMDDDCDGRVDTRAGAPVCQ